MASFGRTRSRLLRSVYLLLAPLHIVLIGLIQLPLDPQMDHQLLVGKVLQQFKGFHLALLIKADVGQKYLRPRLCQL